MELAEAISILEDENQEVFDIAKGFNEKWKEAYKTVIQVAKNSIPKEKVLEKIQELDKIAKKKDMFPETVKEEKLDGSYVYSQRFNADGYIAEVIVNILQELLEE